MPGVTSDGPSNRDSVGGHGDRFARGCHDTALVVALRGERDRSCAHALWAGLHGPAHGRVVTPIHPLAPEAAAKDERLYRLLVIADAFRIGRARDREVARMELHRMV